MNTPKPAKMRWRSSQERGRRVPPSGPTYRATIRFVDGQDNAPDTEWSVLVRLHEAPIRHGYSTVEIEFVSEAAPVDALSTGRSFQLFEGRWPVAEGTVL